VEAGGFQFASDIAKRAPRIVAESQHIAGNQPIDIEHPETDGFHVERANRERKRGALVEKCVARLAFWLSLYFRYQGLQVIVGGLSVIDSSHILSARVDLKW